MLLVLSATGEAIRHGRAFALRSARELGVRPTALPVVELLVSELVTNAVKFGGHGSRVTLALEVQSGQLRIEVGDESVAAPRIDAQRPAHLGGHGMKLVELLASAWGVRSDGAGGKTVWMTMPLDRTLAAAAGEAGAAGAVTPVG